MHESGGATRRTAEPGLIARFVLIEAVAAAAAIVLVSVLNIVSIREPQVWAVVAAFGVLLVALAIASARLPDDPLAALSSIMVGNSVTALAVSVTFPFAWPVMVLVVLLPLVLATPFLPGTSLRLAISASAVVSSAVAAIGLALDDGGVVADIDDRVELVVVIGSLAGLTALVAIVVRQNNTMQREALAEADALNEELAVSERALLDSRRRIVEASDAERHRIERNLHDGAQQRLLALGMRLRLIESQVDDDAAESVAGLAGEVDAAIDELRELAHGIYPPLLEARGLPDALTEAARRAPEAVTVEVAGVDVVGRHRSAVESALYFTALEALANAAKHAPGADVTLRLDRAPTRLRLEIGDDGPGFDTAATAHSSGLTGMRDRVAAVGGEIEITSQRGRGTSVVATTPADDDRRTSSDAAAG